jgi:hypothetical protein
VGEAQVQPFVNVSHCILSNSKDARNRMGTMLVRGNSLEPSRCTMSAPTGRIREFS